MSKRSRRSDNSKRQQPVQQQRAQAALNTLIASKQGKSEGRQTAKGDESPPAQKRKE